MKIRLKDIHPDLRPMAALMRAFYPSSFSEGMLRAADRLQSRFGTGKPFGKKVKYEQIFVPRTDGSPLRLCLYMPPEGCHNAPGLLWMHGGGYALGLPEQDYAFIERFVLASGCFVVAPDYRKSTKAPYPAALHDCYQALLWLKEYGTSYGARKDQIFIGGDSAGGGLCAALSL